MRKLSVNLVGSGVIAAIVLTMGMFARPMTAVALPSAGGMATVRGFYNVLLDTMRNGPQLGRQGRYAQLAPVIERDFNVPFMTQLAVGPDWANLTGTQRQQVTEAFTRYISAVYAERFDSYSGEKLEVLDERPTSAGAIVQTRIIKSDGEPVSLNYLMVDSGGRWQIADVYFNGTISELATRRSEFASILRSQGINGLIATLNRKASVLARTAS